MRRRSYLALAGGAVFPLAGCIGSAPGEPTPSPDDHPLVRSGPGPFPHDISVHNAAGDAASLTITVDRRDTRLYRETHRVDGDSSRVVAGITRRSLPADDQRVTVAATTPDGQSSQVDVAVTDCLGSVDFTIDTAGDLSSTYSIC